jgi:ubiquinone/menaquinone biosynthesis C-methylase UbiE
MIWFSLFQRSSRYPLRGHFQWNGYEHHQAGSNDMSDPVSDRQFTGSIAELYEQYLVPLIFQPYAADIAERLSPRPPHRVLEIAAGTGVVTRAISKALPESVSIVSTDLNRAMLEHAATLGTTRPVEWRQADAQDLPFSAEEFDAVVCQFGAMFFPDKSKAFAEVRRVLKAGGTFIFNVWDRIEDNEFAYVITEALGTIFPDDPPRFLARTPHGYHDLDLIKEDIKRGGFNAIPEIVTVTHRSRATSAEIPAVAYCQGTPLRNEIEARDSSRLEESTRIATDAINRNFGPGGVDGRIQAHVVMVEV